MSLADGFLNVDKPAGCTSRDVVNRVIALSRQRRVGHAGTLDPMATGVLVIAVGRATRLIEHVQAAPKTYVATVQLGADSDTDDAEGTIVPRALTRPAPTIDEVRVALLGFLGEIEQTPPPFSALKVGGQRAYKLARAGREPALAPRRVVIEQIDVLSYAFPILELRARCGKGTYIRALARDIGTVLATGAFLAALRRTAIGSFTVESATALSALSEESWRGLLAPPSEAVRDLPRIALSDDERRWFLRGVSFARSTESMKGAQLAAYDSRGEFLGIARHDATSNMLRVVKGGFASDA